MTDTPRPHHLNLAGAHWQASAAFYRDLLGLVPVELPRDREAYGATIATLSEVLRFFKHADALAMN